jgi:hypothetical protein
VLEVILVYTDQKFEPKNLSFIKSLYKALAVLRSSIVRWQFIDPERAIEQY